MGLHRRLTTQPQSRTCFEIAKLVAKRLDLPPLPHAGEGRGEGLLQFQNTFQEPVM